MPSDLIFSADDIEVLSHAVSIHQNLEYASYATKLARKHLKFPIKSHKGLLPLFAIKDIPERIAGRGVTPAQLKKFFPREFFPIEDSRDFLGKVLAALSWGDVIHYHERFLDQPERFTPVLYPRK